MDRVTLRQTIFEHFNLDEIETLCFDLNIDFEGLKGSSKHAKARELVYFCERTKRTHELVEIIHRFRPNLVLSDQKSVESMPVEKSTEEKPIASPAVVRPINLSFEVISFGNNPAGWFDSRSFVTGVSPNYDIRVVPREQNKGKCALLQNWSAAETEFGSLMQRVPAGYIAGKAIRLQADIKTEGVTQWSGLWLRADGEIVSNLLFDNMSRRPIRGTTAWKKYIIDAQLPKETAWLNYGIVLSGPGKMWADDFKIHVWANNGEWIDL